MQIIISPAKALDFNEVATTKTFSQPQFLEQAEILNKCLAQKTAKQLIKLMNISEKLAQLNWERNQKWQTPFSLDNAKQAVFAFKGDVYTGLAIDSLPKTKLPVLQKKLRILSGLYGLLKPLDLIQPYRLEMGTCLKIGKKANLHQFWNEIITNYLNEELKGKVLVNLASKEYFKAIDVKKLCSPIIEAEFKDYKNGKYKFIYLFAKRARGMMARFIIDNNIEKAEDLKQFNLSGYSFNKNLSSETNFIFTRKNPND